MNETPMDTHENTVQHSPLPWRVEESMSGMKNIVLAADGTEVCAVLEFPSPPESKDEANAALIVAAVNAYAKLREALESAHDTLCDVWRHEAEFMQPHLAQVVLHTGKALEDALKELGDEG